MESLRLGISTCPNDTFAFHALLTGRVRPEGCYLEIELADVEELNRGVASGRFDLAKVSFAAALELAGELVVLPVGAALGFGVGPIVLAPARERPGSGGGEAVLRVLAPGEHTTATLLWRLFHPEVVALEQRRFSEIIPALLDGEADRGVCIHEARFTWQGQGLRLIEDLGERWERATALPLPLGGIVARRSLGEGILTSLAEAIRRSLLHGLAHRDEALPTMRRHAQESAEAVLWKHVELYVNERTLELGAQGRSALAELALRARSAGLLRRNAPALEVH
jgi:1,4-dihydroxy-6-naphthoate synthase